MSLWTPESPFLETPSFPSEALEEESPVFSHALETPWASGETPFLRDEYETQGLRSGELEVVSELLAELKDEAFEDSIYRLAAAAKNFLGDRYNGEFGEAEAQVAEAERQLEHFFSPLVREAENMYERMAEGLERQDLKLVTEAEIESLLSQFAPMSANLEPEFENFLGGLFKKAASVVKNAVGTVVEKGIDFANKGISALAPYGLKLLFERLKPLVRPLISRVIQFALNKLPVGIRPIALRLARRLFGQIAGEMESESTLPANALGAEVIQQEYDLQLAELLLSSEMEAEQSITEFGQLEVLPADPAIALNAAKERFIQEFSRLEKGQDPTPLVQNFLPAALVALRPIIRTVIGIIGRPRVINFLSGLISKLIQRWVGPEAAKLLSTSLADVGLGVLGFETASSDPRTTAAEMVAETLEQTVLQLAQLPEQALENETILEAYAREAFERFASAYFPDGVLRAELRESQIAGSSNVWTPMPQNQKRKYYRKFSRVIDVDITPQVASAIKIFGGSSLTDFFRDILLLPPDKNVKAKVHLYELTLGSRLVDIAMREYNVPGLGNYTWEAWSQIHPLTTPAALALFKEPGLGKDVDLIFLNSPYYTAIGQRFYYLQIPGLVRPVPPPPRPVVPPIVGPTQPTIVERPERRCINSASLTVNLGGARVVFRFQFSEQTAQDIAKYLRQGDIATPWRIIKAMEPMIRGSGFKIIGFELENYLGISTEGQVAAAGGAAAGGAAAAGGMLASLGTKLLEKIMDKLFDILWDAVANYIKNNVNEFIRAAEDPADGVTMYASFVNIPGLAQIRNLRQGSFLGAIIPSLDQSIPRPSISIFPGCNR